MKKRFVAILNSTMEKLNYKPSYYRIVERNNMIGAFYSPIDLDLDYSKNEPKSKPLYIADTSFCLPIGKHAFSDEILFDLVSKKSKQILKNALKSLKKFNKKNITQKAAIMWLFSFVFDKIIQSFNHMY